MAKTIVGVDISASGLRAVELSGTSKDRPVLLRHHSVPLPAGAVARGEVVERRTVATAMKQLWSGGGFTSKDVVLGIGNSRVFARNLSVPKASLKIIRESLPFQVQQMIPFPAEDAVLDFYPINEGMGDAGPVVNGLLVAAVRDAVLGNVGAVQLAGLNTLDVDLIPFALSRVFLRGYRSHGTAAVIDIGANTTTVVVSTDGVPQFIRIIPTGGTELTTALAGRLSIEPAQAEMLKRTVGFGANAQRPEDRNVGGAINEIMSEFMASVRTTLTYFAGAQPTATITRIILTGGGSSLPGLANALSEVTRLPVAIGDPLESVTVRGRGKQSKLGNGVGASLAVAMGLALWDAA